jgi:hypothetical protein
MAQQSRSPDARIGGSFFHANLSPHCVSSSGLGKKENKQNQNIFLLERR